MGDEPVDLELMNAAFRDFVPHNRALGLSLIAATCEPAQVTLKLPWNPQLVGNPATQVLHGGAITTVLDGCAGASVYMKLRSPLPIATLDLRVDFLSRAPAHRDVLVKAECYRVTRSVAFVRAWAWTDDEANPFAAATATFALSTRGGVIPHPGSSEGGGP